MKKLIIASLAAAALMSLSACSTANAPKAASTSAGVESGQQSVLPDDGSNPATITPDIVNIPKPAGQD